MRYRGGDTVATTMKSMRLSARTIEIIEAQAGETFTQKFEALVTRCMWELPEKEKQLKKVEERLAEKQAEIRNLTLRGQNMAKALRTIADSIDNMKRACKTI